MRARAEAIMRILRTFILAAVLAALSASPAVAGGGNSGAAHACQQGGWAELVGSNGETFRNTGECVSFAARGGTFGEPPPPPPTGIFVPAGATLTFDNAVLSACNQLDWGFTIDGASTVVGSKSGGCFTTTPADSSFGPWPTDETVTVFLTDWTCFRTYTNDGDHGITTQAAPMRWDVDIADAGGACERADTPAVFVPPGNLTVDVVVVP
jgi:hypothetical protein